MSKQDTRKIGWSAGTAHMMEGLVGKTKKQLRAEAVERLKEARYHSASDHLCAMLDWGHEPHTGEEAREALIDLLTDDDGEDIADTREHMDNGVYAHMCPYDTREDIEADIDCYRDEDIPGCLCVPIYRVRSWLNRQAAITSSEWCWSNDALEEELTRNAQLTAERDELQRRSEQLEYAYKLASKSEARKIEYIDKLEAERAELRKMLALDDGTIEEYTERADPLAVLAHQKQLAEEWRDRCHNAEAWCDKLESERDQLSRDLEAEHALLCQFEDDNERMREAIDAMGNGQFYAMYLKACEERDHFKDLAITKQTK